LLKGRGPGAGSFDEFWEKVKTQGGWWDASSSEGYTFCTPSKKFEFTPLSFSVTAPEIPIENSPFPFCLHLYPSMAFGDGRGANQPWLQEMPDPMTSVMWGAWVEINPATARKLSIKDGDLLRVESPLGSLTLPACLYPGLRPDVIAIPVGQGHQSYGRFASNRGANAMDLLAAAAPLDGSVSSSRLGARIENTGKSYALAKFGGAGSERNLNAPKR
jgi:anaerobic selenocysteine-containing dehydrogenase